MTSSDGAAVRAAPVSDPSGRFALRAATADAHVAVDAAFGRFRLDDRADYGRFLSAHARALPAAEVALADFAGLPPMRPRTPLLAADLSALGLTMPTITALPRPSGEAAAFGIAYVLEGSRLGGAMIARGVPGDFPKTYLADGHLAGEWRAFGDSLDGAASVGGPAWLAEATAAALACFALYARAVAV